MSIIHLLAIVRLRDHGPPIPVAMIEKGKDGSTVFQTFLKYLTEHTPLTPNLLYNEEVFSERRLYLAFKKDSAGIVMAAILTAKNLAPLSVALLSEMQLDLSTGDLVPQQVISRLFIKYTSSSDLVPTTDIRDLYTAQLQSSLHAMNRRLQEKEESVGGLSPLPTPEPSSPPRIRYAGRLVFGTMILVTAVLIMALIIFFLLFQ